MAWATFPIECGGGLVTNLPPIQQGVQQAGTATKLLNFEASLSGGYARIDGYVKYDAAEVPEDGPILGLKYFDGELVAARGGGVYSSEGAGWTTLIDTRTQTTKHRFTIFNFDGTRRLLGVDGDNPPYVYDGATLTELISTEVDAASFATDFKNHIFFSVNDLLVFSEPFTYDDFDPADGSGTIRLPGPITGLITFREQLFIFTSSSISKLSGSSEADFVLSSVATDIGCVSGDTIQEVAGDVIFLSSDGLRLLSSTERIGDFSNLLSTKAIQTQITEFISSYDDFSSIVIRTKSQYRLFGWELNQLQGSAQGFIGTQFEAQNPHSFAWTQTLGIKSHCADSEVFNGKEFAFFANDTGFVYRLDQGDSFDGEPIESSYWTPWLSISDPTIRKTIYKMHLYLTPTTIVEGRVNLKFDLGETRKIQPDPIFFEIGGTGAKWNQVTWDNFQWASEADTKFVTPVVGSGFLVSLQFEFLSSSGRFNIDTILLEYSDGGRS